MLKIERSAWPRIALGFPLGGRTARTSSTLISRSDWRPWSLQLVAPPHRSGGQAQFIERFRPTACGEDLAPIRTWMLDNLARHQTVDELATRAHMSRRTFIRRFQQETGTSPMAWLTAARIDWARELLETTTAPVERVARLSGLGSPAAFRAAFHRHVGTSPASYRATFQAQCSNGLSTP